MNNSKRVSTITIVIVCIIVVLIMMVACFYFGVFSFYKNGKTMTYDYATENIETIEIREFVENIDGEDNVTLLENGVKVNNSTRTSSKVYFRCFFI